MFNTFWSLSFIGLLLNLPQSIFIFIDAVVYGIIFLISV